MTDLFSESFEERAAIIAGETVVLYDTGSTPLVDWPGTPLLRVTRRATYRANIGRRAQVWAVDPSGRYWYGTHSADWCQCVAMRRTKEA